MSAPATTVSPRDYFAMLGRWWAALTVVVAVVHGAAAGGPALAVLHGLAVLPALWLLGPLAGPYLRARLRQHRRLFGHPSVVTPPDDYRLPATMLIVLVAVIVATCATTQALGLVRASGLEFVLAGAPLGLVAASWELWIFYALRAERRHDQACAVGLPSRTVRRLRRLEGRPELFSSATASLGVSSR